MIIDSWILIVVIVICLHGLVFCLNCLNDKSLLPESDRISEIKAEIKADQMAFLQL